MKKIMKSISLLVTCYCITTKVFAQSDIDAIRYSETNIAATARSLSMAGAFGALGADFSTLSTNPAGIAFYRRSEFTLTPALENRVTSTDYLGKNSVDNKYNFNLGNIGLVWAYPKENKNSAWKGFAFGLGYNRLNSFHSRSFYEGVNTKNSLLDNYVEEATGTDYNNLSDPNGNKAFSSDLAYETWLIDTLNGSSNEYFSSIPNGGELQRRTKETSGSNGEVVISFGGNYNDRIYWGATIGFPFIHYNEDVIYEEIDQNNTIDLGGITQDSGYNAFDFQSFKLSQHVATTGNGFNAKFGIIVKPTDYFRLGAAIHTPAFYSMHDDYSNSISSNFASGNYSLDSPNGSYDYNLTTPFKVIGSAAFIYQQSGILSIDYEFVDYTSAKFTSTGDPFIDVNNTIRSVYTQQHNVRAGAEWKYGIFAFRGGVGYSTGILKSSVSSSNTDQHQITYTGGLGIREASYFVDLGYAYSQSNEFYRPYTLANQDVLGATSKITDHKFLLTVGFRF